MKEQILQLFEYSMPNISVEEMLLRVLAASVFGLAIYLSYWISHAGTIYSQKFNINLITLTILTGMVMTVIGDNLALSLGMVGALSIVRFRTAIKDARDTTYIFWSIVCGICCGVGQFLPAAVGSAAVFIVMLVLGRIRNDVRTLVVVRARRSQELAIEGLIFSYLGARAQQRVKNTTQDSVELMYELTRGALDAAQRKQEQPLTDALYALGGVDYVNIVAQSDEIGS